MRLIKNDYSLMWAVLLLGSVQLEKGHQDTVGQMCYWNARRFNLLVLSRSEEQRICPCQTADYFQDTILNNLQAWKNLKKLLFSFPLENGQCIHFNDFWGKKLRKLIYTYKNTNYLFIFIYHSFVILLTFIQANLSYFNIYSPWYNVNFWQIISALSIIKFLE